MYYFLLNREMKLQRITSECCQVPCFWKPFKIKTISVPNIFQESLGKNIESPTGVNLWVIWILLKPQQGWLGADICKTILKDRKFLH